MPTIRRTAFVPYSASEMYRLVLDVGSYPHFLPWCAAALAREESHEVQIATIDIARGPLKQSFTTRNRLLPDQSIDMDLVEGPFRMLKGRWHFDHLESHGCKVSLYMEFEFGGRLVQGAIGPLFSKIAGQMVHAFCIRAEKVYGRR